MVVVFNLIKVGEGEGEEEKRQERIRKKNRPYPPLPPPSVVRILLLERVGDRMPLAKPLSPQLL